MTRGRVVETVVDALTMSLGGDVFTLHICAVVADKPTVSCFGFLCVSPTASGPGEVVRSELSSFTLVSIIRLNTASVDAANVKQPQPNTLDKSFSGDRQ